MNTKPFIAGLALALCTTAPANPEIEFDPADFPAAPAINVIDNMYWPLISGTSFVYAAETEDGWEVNKVTVTGNVKDDFAAPCDSIAALEIEDLEWLSEECDGEYVLMEKTVDWHAQDFSDNIWYFGEDTLAYEEDEDCVSDEGSFEAGTDGAEAGIVMPGDPQVGVGHRQELYEGEAEDKGKVLKLDDHVELENFGPFTDCLVTKEGTKPETGHMEHKHDCPSGGGLMLIGELHGKTVVVEYLGNSLPAGDFPGELPTDVACADEDRLHGPPGSDPAVTDLDGGVDAAGLPGQAARRPWSWRG